MKHIKVGILGIGNVAVGTYKALEMNCRRIEQSSGVSIDIIKILNRSPEKDRGITVAEGVYTQDPADILDNPQIDIVVELIGGIEPASEYMARALRNGKHVVTANKAAIAAKGDMLQQLALENGVMLRFEASVGGGIPILNALSTALLSNDFDEILGIVNGTTNYILTQMTEYGLDYEDVLKDAQEKGFAERDPSGDVEGIDVANKLFDPHVHRLRHPHRSGRHPDTGHHVHYERRHQLRHPVRLQDQTAGYRKKNRTHSGVSRTAFPGAFRTSSGVRKQ